MKKFFQLAEAQDGKSIEFDYKNENIGNSHNLDISVHYRCATIRMDGKYIGSVDFNKDVEGLYTIMAWNSILNRKIIETIINACDKEDSVIASAWKHAIVDCFQKRVNDAQIALALTMKNLSNI